MNKSEPLMTHRKRLDGTKTGDVPDSQDKSGEFLFIGQSVSGV